MKRGCILISLEFLGGQIGTPCHPEWNEQKKSVNGSPILGSGYTLRVRSVLIRVLIRV
jgi:hypothetical protein